MKADSWSDLFDGLFTTSETLVALEGVLPTHGSSGPGRAPRPRVSRESMAPVQEYADRHGPEALAVRWREDAAVLERRGAGREAELMRGVAGELEAAIEAHRLAELTLEEAAAESGFSRRGIEKMIDRGDLANVGQNGAPRVRRADLPRKATAPRREPMNVVSILERRGA